MNVLKRTQFGNPILREVARELTKAEIRSDKIQQLIADMHHTLVQKELGVALAAPQVGKSVSLVVVAIRPTKLRTEIEQFDLVMINPKITKKIGRRKSMWEGCISSGRGGKADLFAKVPRYEEVVMSYLDEAGKHCEQTLKGLQAQIAQHEIDHLHGILFVDHVEDTKSYMTYTEYMKAKKNNLL